MQSLLVGVAGERSLDVHHGLFIEYPFDRLSRAAPAYVQPPDARRFPHARTDYDLVFFLCSAECVRSLRAALEADDNVVSVELSSAQGGGRANPSEGKHTNSVVSAANGVYIVVTASGDYTQERALQNTIAAHALGGKLGINRYLVDLTEARNVETILTNYEYAKKRMWDVPEIDKRALVALLASPADDSHDFAETVARNAGLRVRLFKDRAEAEAYLLRGEYC